MTPTTSPALTRLNVGFVPLVDCAALVAAADKGFAAAEGLALQLVRETSWANIRDRVIVGQFDAAHMLGPMPIASTLGIGHLKVPMVAPMALNLGGNAITVSTALWNAMQDHGAAEGASPLVLGRALHDVARSRARAGTPPLTLAMVYPYSAHQYQLRYWLAASGLHPDEDASLIVIPPPFMVDALRTGQIDGFCVGEPWNSLAVDAGVGRIVLPTSAIWQRPPEKVLGMRADWAARHEDEAAALVRAVQRAAAWCERRESRPELAALLSQPHYVGAPASLIERALSGRLRFAPESPARDLEDFLLFDDHHATVPQPGHALWFYSQMVRWGQTTASQGDAAAAGATYRPDLYFRAQRGPSPAPTARDTTVGGFFDGRTFDPSDLTGYIAS